MKGHMGVEDVKSAIRAVDETINDCHGTSSPVYGNRKMASNANNQRSSAGSDKESGFMIAPNSHKGPRR